MKRMRRTCSLSRTRHYAEIAEECPYRRHFFLPSCPTQKRKDEPWREGRALLKVDRLARSERQEGGKGEATEEEVEEAAAATAREEEKKQRSKRRIRRWRKTSQGAGRSRRETTETKRRMLMSQIDLARGSRQDSAGTLIPISFEYDELGPCRIRRSDCEVN